jgi:hypothetical protein
MIVHCCSALEDKLYNGRCFVILFYVSVIFANSNDYLNLFIQGYISIVLAMMCQKIQVLLNITLKRPPVIPTPILYLRVTWMLTLRYLRSHGKR